MYSIRKNYFINAKAYDITFIEKVKICVKKLYTNYIYSLCKMKHEAVSHT